jgi:Cys-tRNA(Pro) deacylase
MAVFSLKRSSKIWQLMSKTTEIPVTQAVRALRAAQIAFTAHLYDYVEHGGTAHSATSLGVAEHVVVKTIVLEDEKKSPVICLQHGDREVSTKNLARALGVKTLTPCTPDVAHRHTGYLVGGTSPFGTRKTIPIYIERSILALDSVFINGGKRGFLVQLAPSEIVRILKPIAVDAAA